MIDESNLDGGNLRNSLYQYNLSMIFITDKAETIIGNYYGRREKKK